jgi:hypothetical protein
MLAWEEIPTLERLVHDCRHTVVWGGCWRGLDIPNEMRQVSLTGFRL